MKSDILCISETWLDRTVTDCELDIPNYTLFRNDRNRRGGGVAIYVSDVLTASRRPDLEHQDVESVWLEIINNKKKILLGSYYRPPIAQGTRATIVDAFINKLQASLLAALNLNPDCLLAIGDFNDRCVHWGDDHVHSELGKKLVDLTNTLNLHQLISEPTRYIEHSANILDIIITDSPGLLSNREVSPPIANLDHCVISCSVAFTHVTDPMFSRKMWDYKNANYEGLNAAVQNIMNRLTFTHDRMDMNVTDFNSV
jgi:hypothetical protein